MTQFVFPKDGSIIIVDDKIDEAKPIMELLSKRGLPFTYYDGTEEGLPAEPVQKVRLAFFDIQLGPIQNSHDYAQNIKRLVGRLVPAKNGPFVLILWSAQNEAHGDEVVRQLQSIDNLQRPAAIIRLKKEDFRERIIDNSEVEELIENVVEDVEALINAGARAAIRESIDRNFISQDEFKPKLDAHKQLSAFVERELNTKLDVFQFFIYWEGKISEAAGTVSSQFSNLQEMDSEWSNNFRHVLYRMADAQLEQHLGDASYEDLLNSALKTINATFLDAANKMSSLPPEWPESLEIDADSLFFRRVIEQSLYSIKWMPVENKFQFYLDEKVYPTGSQPTDISRKVNQIVSANEKQIFSDLAEEFGLIVPKINTKLHLDEDENNPLKPGSVVLVKDPGLQKKRKVLSTYFNAKHKLSPLVKMEGDNGRKVYKLEKKDIDKFILIEMEVSPECDFAQKKVVKHRILPGVAIPAEKYVKPSGACYSTPVIMMNNQAYRLVFSFQAFKSVKFDKLKGKTPLFRLRKELLSDILSNLSNHVGRLGVTNL